MTATNRPTRSPSCRAAGSCGQPAQTGGSSSTGTRATVHGAAGRITGGGGGRGRTACAERRPGWPPPVLETKVPAHVVKKAGVREPQKQQPRGLVPQ